MAGKLQETVKQFVDLPLTDDQWRAKRQDIAGERSQNHALVLGKSHGSGANAASCFERPFRTLVRNELDAADQA
jgi:hypothetical protein